VRFQITASTLAGRIVLACMMLFGLGVSVLGRPTHTSDSLEKVWTAYTQAQRQFHQELADFFTNQRPDLKDIIQLNRDLQLALIDRRSLEFRYLLSAHPERIVKDHGISRFANFNWTEADQNVLRHSSAEYEAALKLVEELRKRIGEASEGPFPPAAQQALAEDAEFQKIYERFEAREQAVQRLLEGNP